MTAPRMPRDWTAPLRHAGYEPTSLHVHQIDSSPADTAHDRATPSTDARGSANDSRWHDSSTHPAEWLMLAIAAGLALWAIVAAVVVGAHP
jgi:hypothetical protein